MIQFHQKYAITWIIAQLGASHTNYINSDTHNNHHIFKCTDDISNLSGFDKKFAKNW